MKRYFFIILLICLLVSSSYELMYMRDDQKLYSYDNKCNIIITRNKDVQSVHAVLDDVYYTANRLFSMKSQIDVYFSNYTYDFYIDSTDVGTIAYVYDNNDQTWKGDYALCYDGEFYLWDYENQCVLIYDDLQIPEPIKNSLRRHYNQRTK